MTINASVGSDLRSSLVDFRERFNANPRVKKLVNGWDRDLLIDSTDTGTRFMLLVRNQELTDIREGEPDPSRQEFVVHMQADEPTLIEIFSGAYNPSTALLDGVLAVFSNPRDKVKLEALALLIWGL